MWVTFKMDVDVCCVCLETQQHALIGVAFRKSRLMANFGGQTRSMFPLPTATLENVCCKVFRCIALPETDTVFN